MTVQSALILNRVQAWLDIEKQIFQPPNNINLGSLEFVPPLIIILLYLMSKRKSHRSGKTPKKHVRLLGEKPI